MTIEDLLELRAVEQVRLAYCDAMDRSDAAGMAAIFTEDGICEFGHYGTWHGRETIRTNYQGVMDALGEPFNAIHVVTNPRIKLTGPTTATGRWYLIDLLIRQRPEGGMETKSGHANPLLYLGIYDDEYRKDADGEWRIARTRLHFLWPDKTDDIAALIAPR